jgi:hypothetical protein
VSREDQAELGIECHSLLAEPRDFNPQAVGFGAGRPQVTPTALELIIALPGLFREVERRARTTGCEHGEDRDKQLDGAAHAFAA